MEKRRCKRCGKEFEPLFRTDYYCADCWEELREEELEDEDEWDEYG